MNLEPTVRVESRTQRVGAESSCPPRRADCKIPAVVLSSLMSAQRRAVAHTGRPMGRKTTLRGHGSLVGATGNDMPPPPVWRP